MRGEAGGKGLRAALTLPQSGGSVAAMPPDSKTGPESRPDSPPESRPDPTRDAPKSALKTAGGGAESRQERQARALRDNLKKRKAQQRQRRDGGA